MGRRNPQRVIAQIEEAERAAGGEIPPCGLPASSGFDQAFAPVFQRVLDAANEVRLEPCTEVLPTEPTGTIELDLNGGITAEEEDDEWEVRYSRPVGRKVLFHLLSKKTGRARLEVNQRGASEKSVEASYRFTIQQRTATALSTAHTVGAERAALRKLRTHLNATQWRSYVLSGTFWEVSRKSGLVYVFRRAAPTVVAKLVFSEQGAGLKPIVTLCMHSLGYSLETHAGMMCPSDDVIAHLLMMRANEHFYWRKTNPHTVDDPLSAL